MYYPDKETVEKYSNGIKTLNKFIQKQSDGTFVLIMSKDEPGVDHFLFYELVRSLAHTNYLIKEGLLDPNIIES